MLRFIISGKREKDAARTDALAALYDTHGAQVYGYALALLGDSVEAEDVTQDVFTSLHASGRIPDEPVHYLLRAARNNVYSRLRWAVSVYGEPGGLSGKPRSCNAVMAPGRWISNPWNDC